MNIEDTQNVQLEEGFARKRTYPKNDKNLNQTIFLETLFQRGEKDKCAKVQPNMAAKLMKNAVVEEGKKQFTRLECLTSSQIASWFSSRKSNGPPKSLQYVVSGIVDHTIPNTVFLNRVRWKGFGSESDTWEPAKHMQNCTDILFSYQKENNLPKTEFQSKTKKKNTRKKAKKKNIFK